MFKNSYFNFIFSLVVVMITGILCSWFNRVGMANFYEQIQKSALTPPNIVFPIVPKLATIKVFHLCRNA